MLIEGVAVAEIQGRGLGLVATRRFEACERLFASTAFGYAGSYLDDMCAMCLSFGNFVPRRCEDCPAVYCSEACRAADERVNNHSRCCKALGRIAELPDGVADRDCKSSAAFLLRAFAARHRSSTSTAAAAKSANEERQLPWPTLADALSQCSEIEGAADWSDEREAQRERAVQLASLHGGKRLLSDKAQARALLRRRRHNAYSLLDGDDDYRGWVLYPGASYINHSCVPNCCGIISRRTIIFEALRPIEPHEEIVQCYVRLDGGRDFRPEDWGFSCECPRCAGTAAAEDLAAFDAEFVCTSCGCVTTASRHQATASGGCRCQQNHARAACQVDGSQTIVPFA